MRVPVILAGAILLLSILLQGCGHKGPLYLPQAPDASTQSDQKK